MGAARRGRGITPPITPPPGILPGHGLPNRTCSMSEILIYGAYGYTGRLIVDEARAQGLKPVLAGRDALKTRQLAAESGLTGLAFDLSDRNALDRALQGRKLVLHC